MISNIAILCLNKKLKTQVATLLSNKLDMIHADIDELIKYDIVNPQEVIEKLGMEYFQNVVDKQVYNVSTYENTLITASDEIFTKSAYINILKNTTLIVFIQTPFKKYKKEISKQKKGVLEPSDIINLNMFFDKEKIFSKSAQVTVQANWLNAKHVCKKITKAIQNYYNK